MRGVLSLWSLSAATSLIASAFSHPHVSSDMHLFNGRSDSNSPFPVVGVPGGVQPRLEIRAMASDEPTMFYLFITAMQNFKAANDDLTSYYAISGIHGVPPQDYNGVQQCQDCQGATGYALHNVMLFPAWHRAFVALLEQELYKVAQQVASGFPNNKDMADAAARIRFPYWDWAAVPAPNTNVLPDIITGNQITITGPNGQETIDNPLFSFDFNNPSNLVFTPFTNWNHTLRHPSSNTADATSDESDVSTTLNQQQPSLQDQVYQLLSTCDDYLEFSNDNGGSSSPGCANSLESIHNLIHTYMGGAQSNVSGGHMAYLPLAAFDPVFWLHHANVDRLFAIWQTLHSDSFGGSQVATHSTWTVAANTTLDINSPLEPFYKDASGSFWTSNDVRDWETAFGYTYQGFASTDSQANVAKLVNALYGPNAQYVPTTNSTSAATSNTSASASSGSSSSSIPSTTSSAVPTTLLDTVASSTTSSTVVASKLPASSAADGFGLGGLVSVISNTIQDVAELIVPGYRLLNITLPHFPSTFTNDQGSLLQYVANVRFPRWALGGSYIIYLFNGNPTDNNPISFFTADNLIGTVSALAGGMSADMGDSISSASVPLTRTLQKLVNNGELPNMDNSTVLPYLQQNLVWRIVGPNGTIVDADELKGFQVSCYSSASQQNSTDSLAKWLPFVPHANVTADKPGGATNQTIIKGVFGGHGNDHASGDNKDINAIPAPPSTCSGLVMTQYVTVTRAYGAASAPTNYNVN